MPQLIGMGWFQLDKFRCPPDTTVVVDAHVHFNEPNRTIWYIQVEPEAYLPSKDYLLTYGHKFGKIFTFHQEVLDKCPNAVKYVYGTTWIENRTPNIKQKQFAISSITGGKARTIGHKFRLELYKHHKRCPIPSTWFQSSSFPPPVMTKNPVIGKSKDPLFTTFQFSLVIENSRQANYFTEKLMDCIITKTIPVYYGCPNIADYFDTTGWVILDDENVERAFEKIRQLTPSWYGQYTEVIEKNWATAHQYADIYENLNRV